MKDQYLRILMVAPQPFFRARGTPFSVLHRIRALVEAGHEVDLITYPFGEDIEMQGLNIIRASGVIGVRDIRIGPSIAKICLDVPLYFATSKALREKTYDVLHSHEEAAFFCMGLARKHKLIHIYDMHSSLPHQLSNFKAFDIYPIRKPFEVLENKVLSSCDGVITICDELAQIAIPKCGNSPHAMIENTGDDRKVFGADTESGDVRDELNLRNQIIVLYTGTFEEYQGIDLLIECFALVRQQRKDIHLILLGGRDEQVSRYRQLSTDQGVGDAVTFTGTIHPSQVQRYLSSTDMIISPRSRGTNTPLKIYGYLRSGKPLIATDRLTHTQTLTNEISLLVPASAEGLASGIIKLTDEPETAARLANTASDWAAEHFSDDLYVSRVLEFYSKVCESKGSPLLAVNAV